MPINTGISTDKFFFEQLANKAIIPTPTNNADVTNSYLFQYSQYASNQFESVRKPNANWPIEMDLKRQTAVQHIAGIKTNEFKNAKTSILAVEQIVCICHVNWTNVFDPFRLTHFRTLSSVLKFPYTVCDWLNEMQIIVGLCGQRQQQKIQNRFFAIIEYCHGILYCQRCLRSEL